MAAPVEFSYDVLCEVFQHVDDVATSHSLLLTSRTFYDLTAPKVWENLRLTTHASVASAFQAVLKKLSLRPWVRSIRLPDGDSRNNPPPGYDSDPDVGLLDQRVLAILGACSLTGLSQAAALSRRCWSWTEAKTAAIMALCPNLETAVLDSLSPRSLLTLCDIL